MCDKALAMCRTYDDLIAEAASLLRFYAAKTIGEPYLELNRLANDLEYKAADIGGDEWAKQDDAWKEWKVFKSDFLDANLEYTEEQNSRYVAPFEFALRQLIADDITEIVRHRRED